MDGVKTRPYSERSQLVLPARLRTRAMKSNRWLGFPPMRPHFVVAMKPSIIQWDILLDSALSKLKPRYDI